MDRPTDPAKLTTRAGRRRRLRVSEPVRLLAQEGGARSPRDVLARQRAGPWSSTHPEVHPKPVTYLELLSETSIPRGRSRRSGQRRCHGPGELRMGRLRTLRTLPDSGEGRELPRLVPATGEGSRRQGEDASRERPRPPLVSGGHRRRGQGDGAETTPAVVAAREQAPRSLWDPSYVEKSWITADTLNNKGIDLIPRIEGLISKDNPGMSLDFSEWNYGGAQSISGGITTADMLGIFGRYGVHAAALWPLAEDSSSRLRSLRHVPQLQRPRRRLRRHRGQGLDERPAGDLGLRLGRARPHGAGRHRPHKQASAT